MNVLNRILMIVLCLAALVAGIIILLLLGGFVAPVQVSPQSILLRQWSFFTHLNGSDATAAAIVGIVLILVGLVLLIVELLPGRRVPAQFVVRSDGLGQVTVARTSVRDLISHEAITIPGVVETRQSVEEGPKGLSVHIRASLAPEVVAPEVGLTLQEHVREALQRHIGLPVATVQVATQIEPLEKHAQRRVR